MYTGQIAVISNKATWRSDVYELIDSSDGEAIDLSDPALTVDVVVTITEQPASCCSPTALATASIANGKASIPGPGFQWQFEVPDLTNLCAGNYKVGAKITVDDFVTDLIIGTVAVLEGN